MVKARFLLSSFSLAFLLLPLHMSFPCACKSCCLSVFPHTLFLQGHQSNWIKVHSNDFNLITSLHLFVSSSISFINVLYSSVYKSFTSLVKVTPKYFVLFVNCKCNFVKCVKIAVVNGIVFLISVCYSLLLVLLLVLDWPKSLFGFSTPSYWKT